MVWLRNSTLANPFAASSVQNHGLGQGGADRGELECADADDEPFDLDGTLLIDDPLDFFSQAGGLNVKREWTSPLPGDRQDSLRDVDVKPVLNRGGDHEEVGLGPLAVQQVCGGVAVEVEARSFVLRSVEDETDAELDVDESKEAVMNTCEDCGDAFSSALQRLQHKCQRGFKCSVCAWKGASRRAVRAHEARVHSAKTHPCPDCGVVFTGRGALVSHARTHARALRAPRAIGATCTACGAMYTTPSNLKRHERQCRQRQGDVKPTLLRVEPVRLGRVGEPDGPADVKSVRVRKPSWKISERDDVKPVRLNNNYTVKPFHCKLCLAAFWHRARMLRHVEKVHTMKHAHKCDVCVASYSSRSALDKHKRVHSLPRLFTCSLCFVRFEEREQLIKHLMVHLAPPKDSAVRTMDGVTAIAIKKELGEGRRNGIRQ